MGGGDFDDGEGADEEDDCGDVDGLEVAGEKQVVGCVDGDADGEDDD